MTALFVLAQEHHTLAARLQDMELDEQTIADTLEAESGALEAKATATAMVARNLESVAAAIKEHEAAMAARRKALEKRAEHLRAYLLANMLHAGIKKVEHPMLTLAVKGKAASVVVFDEAQIPAEFMDQPPPPPPKVSKTRIGAALKAGATVPGAKMGDDVYRLEIA